MQYMKNVYIKKNESKRLLAKCMECCLFHMMVGKSTQKNYFQVVSVKVARICHMTKKISLFVNIHPI